MERKRRLFFRLDSQNFRLEPRLPQKRRFHAESPRGSVGRYEQARDRLDIDIEREREGELRFKTHRRSSPFPCFSPSLLDRQRPPHQELGIQHRLISRNAPALAFTCTHESDPRVRRRVDVFTVDDCASLLPPKGEETGIRFSTSVNTSHSFSKLRRSGRENKGK